MIKKVIYLVVDIGNTLCKIALYKNREILEYLPVEEFENGIIENLISKFGTINAAIVSSTSVDTQTVVEQLKALNIEIVENFDHSTPLPIANSYETPNTLGLDRLASAVAASQKFQKKDIIIFDLGTAITIDYVSNSKEFKGGNISPGLEMRFKALNHFTKRLPLLTGEDIEGMKEEIIASCGVESIKQKGSEQEEQSSQQEFKNFGKTTQQAIFYGVVQGICNEIEGYLMKNSTKTAFFTGGDALFFEKLIKIPIFVDWQATLNGLQVILERICIEKF